MNGVSSSPGREVHSLLAWAALSETKVTDHQFDTDLPTSKGKIKQCLDPTNPMILNVGFSGIHTPCMYTLFLCTLVFLQNGQDLYDYADSHQSSSRWP